MASSNPTSAAAPSSLSTPTPSETLVQSFLAAHPALDKDLGDVAVMTDRYTNKEWAAQIAETQRKVQDQMGAATARKYEVPAVGSRAFAETIDHTLLKLDATGKAIDDLCAEARTEGFKSVCVRLNYVSRCVANLKGSPVLVACVVGFHEGTQDTYDKLRESRAAVGAGARELDVVLNHSILTSTNPPPPPRPLSSQKRDSTTDTITWANTTANSKPSSGTAAPSSGPYSVVPAAPSSSSSSSFSSSAVPDPAIPDYSAIYRELASIRSLCPSPTVLKLILETSQLDPGQILAAAHLAAAANFDFIKTSTGFNGPGAKLEDVRLMVAASEYLSTAHEANGGLPVRARKMEVKASGGVRSLDDAVKMLEAGATRLGTSSGLWIMQESRLKLTEGESEGEKRPGTTRLYTDESVGGY